MAAYPLGRGLVVGIRKCASRWDVPGTWNKIFSEVWQHKLMVKDSIGLRRFVCFLRPQLGLPPQKKNQGPTPWGGFVCPFNFEEQVEAAKQKEEGRHVVCFPQAFRLFGFTTDKALRAFFFPVQKHTGQDITDSYVPGSKDSLRVLPPGETKYKYLPKQGFNLHKP